MELKSLQAKRFGLSDEILKEFFCEKLAVTFIPSLPESSFCNHSIEPSLFTLDLFKILTWLHLHDYPKPFEKEICDIPVLLFAPNFNLNHLLFHFDGTAKSANLIRKFITLFGGLIHESKSTIISPNFTPKSKIHEEREIIQLVTSSTKETSFIKFNFSRIGDFWSYGIQHDCTLLVTTKNYQAELAKVLFHFYKGKIWSNQLSFYLSV